MMGATAKKMTATATSPRRLSAHKSIRFPGPSLTKNVICADPLLKTPHNFQNTAARGVTFRIDWLSFTFPSSLGPAVKALIAGDSAWAHAGRPKNGYRKSENIGLVRLFSEHKYGGEHAQLLLTGAALSPMPLTEQLLLIRRLRSLGCRIARLDLAYDDHAGVISLDRVAKAWDTDEVVCHWRTSSERRDKKRRGCGTSRSIYFGSRYSGSSICFYDKGLESDDEAYADTVRIELRLRGKAANEAVDEFEEAFEEEFEVELIDELGEAEYAYEPEATIPTSARSRSAPKMEELCDFVGNHEDTITRMHFYHDLPALDSVKKAAVRILKRRIDFRDRTTGSGNVTRAERSKWWEEFLERVDPDPVEAERLDGELRQLQQDVAECGLGEIWELAGRRNDVANAIRQGKERLESEGERAANDAFGRALTEYCSMNPGFELIPLQFPPPPGQDDFDCEDSDSSPNQHDLRVIEGGAGQAPSGDTGEVDGGISIADAAGGRSARGRRRANINARRCRGKVTARSTWKHLGRQE